MNTVGWIAVLGSTFFLKWFGRKTLFIWSFVVLAIFSVGMSICMIYKKPKLQLLCTLFFFVSFQFGPGPVSWLYNAEISKSKALSLATTVTWLLTLVVAIITQPLLTDWTINYTFFIFAVTNLLAALFCVIVLKETKGKTPEELKVLYVPKTN